MKPTDEVPGGAVAVAGQVRAVLRQLQAKPGPGRSGSCKPNRELGYITYVISNMLYNMLYNTLYNMLNRLVILTCYLTCYITC